MFRGGGFGRRLYFIKASERQILGGAHVYWALSSALMFALLLNRR